MRVVIRNLRGLVVALFLAAVCVVGCGDSGNNDQGVSVLFTGWFQDIGGATGLTFVNSPVSLADTQEALGDSGLITFFAGLQNNLSGQGVRIERIHHEFFVPGGGSIPPTSVGAPFQLGAEGDNNSETFGGQTSSLPDSFAGLPTTGFLGVPIITPDIFQFIRLNLAQFPEPPFVVTVRSYATGVTTAGIRVNTNSTDLDIIFTPDVLIN